MMRIVHQGTWKKTFLNYECDRCGCVFYADDDEYNIEDYMPKGDPPSSYGCVGEAFFAKCDCPQCGLRLSKVVKITGCGYKEVKN